MRLLLDTNALIWWALDHPRLGADAREAIADPGNDVSFSAASVWEAEIKRAKGKLDFPPDLAEQAVASGLSTLAVTPAHATRAGRLPLLHTDPFDRMLVAQAQLEGFAIVTSDRALADYGVAILPA